jgi:hypothetical protein
MSSVDGTTSSNLAIPERLWSILANEPVDGILRSISMLAEVEALWKQWRPENEAAPNLLDDKKQSSVSRADNLVTMSSAVFMRTGSPMRPISSWNTAKWSLAVVGSRGFKDYDRVCKVLDEYSIGIVVSGGADGADDLAKRYAKERGLVLVELIPDWKRHGRSAGMIRNQDIVKRCDRMVAFWDGKSPGTADAIDKAKKLKKPVQVERYM